MGLGCGGYRIFCAVGTVRHGICAADGVDESGMRVSCLGSPRRGGGWTDAVLRRWVDW